MAPLPRAGVRSPLGHRLQCAAGTGKQVRSLAPPKDAGACSPREQERPPPTQRAAQTRKCSGGCRPTTHRPHGGMLGPLPDALARRHLRGTARASHAPACGTGARDGARATATCPPRPGGRQVPARRVWVRAGGPRPREHTRLTSARPRPRQRSPCPPRALARHSPPGARASRARSRPAPTPRGHGAQVAPGSCRPPGSSLSRPHGHCSRLGRAPLPAPTSGELPALFFWGSSILSGPAPLAGAPRTPFSDRLHSVMSQSLADITGTDQAQGWGDCGQVWVASLPGGGPVQATQPYRAWWTLWQVPPPWHLDSGDPGCSPFYTALDTCAPPPVGAHSCSGAW